MSNRTTTVRFRADGTLVRVNEDGREELVSLDPIAPKSEIEIEASAAADAENPPITPERRKRLLRVPRVKTLRRALGLTQEEFANRYAIAIGTLRDWEQGRTEPDQAAQAYLNLIAHDPAGAARPALLAETNSTMKRAPGFHLGQRVYPKAAPSLQGAIIEVRQSPGGGLCYKVFHSAELVREYGEEQLAATWA